MERIHVKGNTWCFQGRQLIPYYQIDDRHCILLDSGSSSVREELERALSEADLTPVGIVLTHMHYDHHENTGYFKKKFGIPAAMQRYEAEICQNAITLKNHLFCFSPGMIAQYERLNSLICPIERLIELEETEITFQGVKFGIVHSPGHAPGHICIVTPDNVAYLGDAIMAGRDLEQAKIIFVFGMELDFESKRRLLSLSCDRYILAHFGILDSIEAVVKDNLELMERQIAMIRSLVTKPMNMCECYEAINQKLNQAESHPMRILYLERYLRPYLEYLVDSGQVKLVEWKGAPTLAPLEWQQ